MLLMSLSRLKTRTAVAPVVCGSGARDREADEIPNQVQGSSSTRCAMNDQIDFIGTMFADPL
jgi:hypothetical protein